MPELCAAEYLNRPGDSQKLASTMEKLATDLSIAETLAQSAFAGVHYEYTLDLAVRALESLYQNQIDKYAR